MYLPGDIIIEAGDPGDELFIVRQGVVKLIFGHVLDENGNRRENLSEEETKFLRDGSFFGELALLTAMPRVCSAVSHTVSELSELSKKVSFSYCFESKQWNSSLVY